MLGDSIAFGYWVAEEDGFPRQLEAMLNPAGATGDGSRCSNFGVPGYNLDQEIETLRSKALAFSPDLVLVAFCLNDLEGLFSYELGLVQDRAERARLVDRPLARGLSSAARGFSPGSSTGSPSSRPGGASPRRATRSTAPSTPRRSSQQKAALDGQAGRAARAPRVAAAIPGVVVVFPALGRTIRALPAPASFTARCGKRREGAGLAVVDLLDCYSSYDFRDLRVDVVHPSPLGHRVAAHAIRDALCARGWLCKAPPPGLPCTAYRASDFPTVRGY